MIATISTTLFFVFDNGGTIIDDPFPESLLRLRAQAESGEFSSLPICEEICLLVFDHWEHHNRTYTFPLASHFLQEEVWILRALLTLSEKNVLARADIPLIAPPLLYAYRRAAKTVIAAKPTHRFMASALEKIRRAGGKCCVASNDREFATRAMLGWAGLLDKFDWVVTSEGLSGLAGELVEKPNQRFFELLESTALGDGESTEGRKLIYVGDSEQNDIRVPGQRGYTTVRYINSTNDSSAVWIDATKNTAADYSFTSASEIPDLVDRIIRDLA